MPIEKVIEPCASERRRPPRKEPSLREVSQAIHVAEDKAIPLATVGGVQRELVPIAVPENMQVTDQKVVDALNASLATREIDARVNTSEQAQLVKQQLIWRHWIERERALSDWSTTATNSATTLHHWQNEVWGRWHTSGTTGTAETLWRLVHSREDGYIHSAPIRRVPPPPPTPEELARQQAIRNAEEAARKARVAAIDFAKEKAEKLLLSVLNPQQKEELKSKGYFHCKSQKGFVYRIYRGTHGNVKRLDERGREVESLCVQPDNVPVGDAMLAQKLHIEFNEDEFRKIANITRLMN